MELILSYRHLEPNKQLEELIAKKANKLTKFGTIKVEWTCSKDGDLYESDVAVSSNHHTVYAKASGDSLSKTLDVVISKLEKQLAKTKEKND